MTTSPVFGDIYVSSNLTADVTTCLQKWFATYLREVEAQASLTVGGLPEPVNYTSRNKYDSLPGEELPKCIVICPGLIGTPVKRGTGQYSASWRVGVGVAIAGASEEEAERNAKVYGAVVRAIMLQKAGEFGADDIQWVDEAYDDLPLRDQIKQYRAVAMWFSVTKDNLITRKFGPLEPNTDPYAYNTADTVDIELEKETIR